jgi:hypothetical protein
MMPHSAGWYDDPDSSGALRYFDGRQWTPQRKRKPPGASYPPASPAAPSDSFGQAYTYPVGPIDAYAALPPGYMADPYAPTSISAVGAFAGPADPYAAASAGAVAPHGTFPAGVARNSFPGIVTGADRVVGLCTVLAGVALVVTSFLTWGRATTSQTLGDDTFGSATLSFPGLGDPTFAFKVSGGDGSLRADLDVPRLHTMHSTNPGWIALALGVVAIVAGVAYLWLRHRLVIAVVVSVGSGVTAVMLLSQLLDLPGAFGNPPGIPADKFSPGLGLVAACLLSFGLTAAAIATAAFQWRQQYRNASP